MNFKNLIMCLMICLLAFACRKDDISDSEDILIPEPAVEVDASVIGIVIDEDGNALSDVAVLNENTTIITDENGYFEFSESGLNQNGLVIQFDKDGYFDNYKFVLPNPGSSAFLKVMMVTQDNVEQVSGASGGTVQTNGGASVTLPAGGIVDANGNAYQGQVSVYTHWYDPTSDELAQSMPGDLRGIDAEGQVVQLATFGMMAVELRSNTGQELNLADGQTATLEFPVPTDLQSNATEEIPLWSLNEDAGYWQQEGTATLQAGKYIGTVSHFSFWNCDAPFPLVKLSGTFQDTDGNPIKWAEICITVTTSGMAGYGWTDQEGNFCGKVPKDKTLRVELKNECWETVYSEVHGPFSTDEDLGEIVIDYQYGSAIEGRLMCSGMPVSNGYVVIEYENGTYTVIDTDQDGYFSGFSMNCESYEFSLQGFDPVNATNSDVLEFTSIPGQTTSIGDVETCVAIDEYMRVKTKIGGNESPFFLIDELFEVSFVGDNLTLDARLNNPFNSVNLLIANPQTTGPNIPINASINAPSIDNGNGVYLYCGAWGETCIDLISVEFSLLNFQEGEYIEGSFIAEQNGLVICGEFRMKIDEVRTGNGSISGVIWEDDGDGIRQGTEPLLPNVVMQLLNEDNGFLTLGRTNSDGAYAFNNLPTDEPLKVFFAIDGYVDTPLNAGTNTSVDNDFEQVQQDSGYITQPYDLAVTPVQVNVDAGLKVDTSTPLNCSIFGPFSLCDGMSADVEVNPTGGVGPYTYEWSTGETDNFIVVTQPGLYYVEVVDANGNRCVAEWFIEQDNLTPTFIVNQPECGDNNGSILLDFGQPDDTYIWYMDGVQLSNSVGPDLTGLSAGVYTVEYFSGNCDGSQTFTLFNNSNTTIGNRLWIDEDGNGVQDTFELGIEGMLILLLDENDQVVDSTYTNAGPAGNIPGNYQFFGQYEGSYSIQVELNDDQSIEYDFVDPFVGNSTENDSNIETSTTLANGRIVGSSGLFDVKLCETKNDIDIGLYIK